MILEIELCQNYPFYGMTFIKMKKKKINDSTCPVLISPTISIILVVCRKRKCTGQLNKFESRKKEVIETNKNVQTNQDYTNS